ncbi:putative cytochrome P450 protein, partial [Podospora didyma]
MYNYTTGSAQETWRERVDGLLDGIKVFFTGNKSNIMTEVACEPVNLCDLDQQSFKAYLSRWMAATTKWAPWTYDRIKPLLEASATAAVSTCIGGDNGRMCGLKWTEHGKFDNSIGVGQQMAAMEIVLANMIQHATHPVTNNTGGTSAGDPGAGGSDVGRTNPFSMLNSYPPVTTAGQIGAYVCTVIFVLGLISGCAFVLAEEASDQDVEKSASHRLFGMGRAARGSGGILGRTHRRSDSDAKGKRALMKRSNSAGSSIGYSLEKDDIKGLADSPEVSVNREASAQQQQPTHLPPEGENGKTATQNVDTNALPPSLVATMMKYCLALAILGTPLSAWMVFLAYRHIVVDVKHTTLPSWLLIAGLAVAAFKLNLYFFRRFMFERRAWLLGCGPAPVYPHKDPILGLDYFHGAIQALNSHTLLDFFSKRFEQWGNTHYTLALGKWLLLTNEGENIKAILATKVDDWPIAGPRLFSILPLAGPLSLFASNGPAWHEARAMVRPAFVRDQIADLKRFERHINNFLAAVPADGSTFDMQKLLLDMTMDLSTEYMLGYSTNMLTNPSPDAQQFVDDFEYASRESAKKSRLGPLLFYLPHRRMEAAVERIQTYIRFYIQKAVAEAESKRSYEKKVSQGDEHSYVFLEELLKANPTEEYIVAQLISIMFAARDTTAVAMSAAFYYLARDPAAVEKLLTEMDDLGVHDDDSPTWEKLRRMTYLNNVVKEAMRLFPPVSTNSRASNKETILPRGGGPDGSQPILVPQGTPVRWSIYSLHRRKDIFGADADEFRPERWEASILRAGWNYIPFQGGPRICPGQQFTLTQITYALFKFFQKFRAYSIEPRDDGPLRYRTNMTVSFADGCLVGVVP